MEMDNGYWEIHNRLWILQYDYWNIYNKKEDNARLYAKNEKKYEKEEKK